MADDKATDLINDLGALKSDASPWLGIWQECIDNFLPTEKGPDRLHEQRDSPSRVRPRDKTGVLACQTFAAGMFSYVCPNDREWCAFQDGRPDLQEEDEVKRYWDEVSSRFRLMLYQSNFPSVGHQAMGALGAVGIDCVFLDEGKSTLFNFRRFPVGSYYIQTDDEGRVDTVFRCFRYTAAQAVKRFGEDALSEEMRKAYTSGNPADKTRRFDLLHVVRPRAARERGRADARNMPYESIYIDVAAKHTIAEGGYRVFPYIIFREETGAGSVYPWSIGMSCLDELKTLNRIEETTILAEEKAVNPPILKHADSSLPIKSGPGNVTLYETNKEPREWQQGNLKVGVGLQALERKQDIINKFFRVDLFELLAQLERGQMTAYEVGQRVREKLVVIAPLVSLVQESLTQLMRRGYDLMNQAGELPMPPPAMGNVADFKVVYDNRITMALRAIENDSILEGLSILTQMLGISPDVLDNVDMNETARMALENIRFPQKAIRPLRQVQQIQQQRAQAQAMAEGGAIANQGADTLNKLPPEIREQMAALQGA